MVEKTIAQPRLLACSECGTSIDPTQVNSGRAWRCRCGQETTVWAFPAALRDPAPTPDPRPASDEDAACFFHHGNQATVSCARCGLYVCVVCDCEVDGASICPQCLERARREGDVPRLKTRYSLLDSRALLVALVPLILALIILPLFALLPQMDLVGLVVLPTTLMFFPGVFTGPAALVLAIRAATKWEPYVVPRSRTRYLLALGISGFHCVFLILFLGLALFFAFQEPVEL